MLTKERRKSNMNVKERRVEEYNGGGMIITIYTLCYGIFYSSF